MVNLTGSDKQVTWAVKVRDEKLRAIIDLLKGVPPYRGHEEDSKCLEDIRVYKNLIYSSLSNINSAKWWIDNRNMTRLDLLNWIVEHNSKVAKYKQDFYWRYANDS